ncbi:PspC domain-containing protein [uncultured Draconibacterium sp.]|uniref:PspC domain-containing protein n=1 Tax=uncultured Draconibacterium sp. TaxID=1573823 RepID=UPI0025D9D793|nr:PspC domain-containing protein [uncultured Draconibacterium sp.]
MATNRLYRSRNRVLGGVLAGIAEYFAIDVILARVIYVLLSLFSAGFPGLLVYIICWAIIPEKPIEMQ